MINTLLLGQEGLNMLDDALDMAANLLKTDNLDVHPDYLFVDLPKGKKSIGVDEVLPIVQKANFKPALAEQSIVVINHMDCLTEAAQNKLLLTLENNLNLLLIGVSYRDTLLPTVKSRMKVVEYHTYTKEAFLALAKDRFSEQESLLLYFASGGCPNALTLLADKLAFFSKIYAICQGEQLQELLPALGLLKEKDPSAVSGDKKLMVATLHVLQYALIEKAQAVLLSNPTYAARLSTIVERLLNEEMICLSPRYTASNFFNTMAYLINEGTRH